MSVKVIRHVGDLAVVEPPGHVPAGFALAVRPPGRLTFLLEASVEREVAIRDLARGSAQVVSHDDAWRFVAVEGSLGISLGAFLEEVDSAAALDPLVIAFIGHAVALAVAEVHATCGVNAGRIVDSRVWLSWSGDVVLTGPFDLALDGARTVVDDPRQDAADLALLMRGLVTGVSSYSAVASSPEELYRLERGKWDQAPPEWRLLASVAEPRSPPTVRDELARFLVGHEREARALLEGTLANLFPRERARDLEWQEELFIEDITDVDPGDLRGPTLAEFAQRIVTLDDGGGPPLLVTDVVPRSVVVEIAARGWPGLEELRAWAPTAAPATNLTMHQAAMLAAGLHSRYPGFRLPSSAEWDRVAAGGGPGRPSTCGARGFCRVWEWTSTPRQALFIVRGGRWRNQRRLASINNLSDEDTPGPDIGFRAVAYRDPADMPDDEWDMRT